MKENGTHSQSFVYNDDIFCEDINDLLEYLLLDYADDLSDMGDDWEAKVELTRLEPMINFDANWILECVDDDRIDEDGTSLDKFAKVLKQYESILNEINEKVPKLYYGINRYITITKQDLIDNL